MNQVGMHLTKGDQRPSAAPANAAEPLQKLLSVLYDRGPGIVLGEAQIQSSPPVNRGGPARPCAKAMHEPGK